MAWLAWAKGSYRIGKGGWLEGEPEGSETPRAVRFWLACEARIRAAGSQPNAEESQFALDGLLVMEAYYPVTHFVATDGSRQQATQTEPTKVGRVAVLHDGEELTPSRWAHGRLGR